MPDASAILVDLPDSMVRHIVGLALRVNELKSLGSVGRRTYFPKGDHYNAILDSIKIAKFELSRANSVSHRIRLSNWSIGIMAHSKLKRSGRQMPPARIRGV